jgi:hypothetical protein
VLVGRVYNFSARTGLVYARHITNYVPMVDHPVYPVPQPGWTSDFQLEKYPVLEDNCLYPIPPTDRQDFDPRCKEHRLSRYLLFFALLAFVYCSPLATARPYPGLSGLAASADSAETAATNPAGITRFKRPALEGEIMWFSSDSEWESEFSNSGSEFNSKDSTDTVIRYERRVVSETTPRTESHGTQPHAAALNNLQPGACMYC